TPPDSILSPSKWQQFWHLRIPINARNTWYRFLHRKISSRQRLHGFQPDIFDPYCPLCHKPNSRRNPAHIENNQHFMYACPQKILVWTTAVVHYIDPTLDHFNFLHYYDILTLRTNITRTTSVPFPSLSVYQVFSVVLQAIWTAHYRFVFLEIPFVPLQVLSSIHKALAYLEHEENLHLEI
ncbi:hypothetical protein BD408DRAFT_351844, partial [Parasitella parasitica]